MAIEFGCGDCGKLLSVPDDSAGKQARCPACGNIQGIPDQRVAGQSGSPIPGVDQRSGTKEQSDSSQEPTKPTSQTRDEPTDAGANPFDASSGNPFSEQASSDSNSPFATPEMNPYQSPASEMGSAQSIFAGGNRDWARVSVEGPANSLAAVAGVVIFFTLIGLAFNLIQLLDGGDIEDVVITAIGSFVLLIPYGLILYGTTQMKQLKSYHLSVAISILAMLPCSGCCIIGLPVGIWSLVVLLKPDIRAAFQ